MEVKLDKTVYSYLLNHLLSTSENIKKRVQIIEKHESIYITLSDIDKDEIRNLALDRMQIAGYNEDYEPTGEGKILEKIIDLFY